MKMPMMTRVISRVIILLLILFSSNILSASIYNESISPEILSRIRQDFYAAIEDGDVIDKTVTYIESIYKDEPEQFPAVILAYYGGLETLKAKHSYNPVNKFRYVISGIKMLNKAVERSPSNLEVRFLRFAVLHHIPGVFGISKDRENDLFEVYSLLLQKDYSSIDKELQKGIAEFLIDSNRLNYNQKNNLKMIFPNITER